jgi:hypothetical protein
MHCGYLSPISIPTGFSWGLDTIKNNNVIKIEIKLNKFYFQEIRTLCSI